MCALRKSTLRKLGSGGTELDIKKALAEAATIWIKNERVQTR